VDEDGEGHAELAAVEGTLRLANHDGIEVTASALDRVEQAQRLRPALPWQRAREPDVEELGNDLSADRFDQAASTGKLPGFRRLRVLLVPGLLRVRQQAA
jgi:hypothetical protein